MKQARPGLFEREIVGKIEGIPTAAGAGLAFRIILTVNGEILHSRSYNHLLEEGRLLLTDAGAESAMHYASDITRTIPVSGRFSTRQKEIYELVLKGQEWAINAIKPGVPYKDIHLGVAKVFAAGLKEIGLMKGRCE